MHTGEMCICPTFSGKPWALSHHGVAKGSKVDAVLKMPAPADVPMSACMCSLLGSTVQFYIKFIANLLYTQSTGLCGHGHSALDPSHYTCEKGPRPSDRSHRGLCSEPLHYLCHKDTPWKWGTDDWGAFQHLKDALCTDEVLTHFDPCLEIGISCNASLHSWELEQYVLFTATQVAVSTQLPMLPRS